MKLGTEYRLRTVSQNTTLNVGELIEDCLNFLHMLTLDQDAAKKLAKTEHKLREIERIEDKDKMYKCKKEILFQDIFNMMEDISPEGCYFGTHPRDFGLIGFWDKSLFSATQ
ncbi:MAG: hypothetical protein PVF36_11745 [Desulfobacterales bacterium]|jgi:hypothetical protein